jgi:hypothetical protein
MADDFYDEMLPPAYVSPRLRSPRSWWLRRFALGRLIADRERRTALLDVLRADVLVIAAPGDLKSRAVAIDHIDSCRNFFIGASAEEWRAERVEAEAR